MNMLKIGTKVCSVIDVYWTGTVVGYGHLDNGPDGVDTRCENDPWTVQPVYLVKAELVALKRDEKGDPTLGSSISIHGHDALEVVFP